MHRQSKSSNPEEAALAVNEQPPPPVKIQRDVFLIVKGQQAAVLAVKGQPPCEDPGGCIIDSQGFIIDSQRPEGSCSSSQGTAPTWRSRGLYYWQSKTSNSAGIETDTPAVSKQHSFEDPGGCTAIMGHTPLCVGREGGGRRGQGAALAVKGQQPLGVQAAVLAVKGQYPCEDPGGYIDSQGQALLSELRRLP